MTTPTRFQRLEALFHEVVDLDEADRAAILETVRRREPDLHDELDQLLARERERDGGELLGLESIEVGPGVGDRVGPFRLALLLGEGGMGRVYEAEQTDPVRRRVALKLIQPHLWGAMARARFARERQALAALSHPGIAQVLEAGSTPDGLPWVALELVDGRPVTELCDDRRRPVAARIELMIEILRAVQHAHLRGILHRDLKPSNLLVIEREGALRPKIIDFGLAKAVSEEGSEATLRTRLGEVIGTPEYMSPEQTMGGAVDARTDIYSLGVVLHELLAGVRPHEAASTAPTAADELRRRIREEDPPRPSARIGSWRTRATSPTVGAPSPRPCGARWPTISTGSCCARWPRIRSGATNQRPPSPPTSKPISRIGQSRRGRRAEPTGRGSSFDDTAWVSSRLRSSPPPSSLRRW